MKYNGVLIAVSNMENSLQFYRDVMGLKVVEDFGENVTLEGGIFLQTLDTWKTFIQTDRVVLPNSAGELYFEEEDIEGFCSRLTSLDVRCIHPLFEHRWGQRGVRFYDPDGHIIEVGERMDIVVRRFFEGGLSAAETAAKMDVPISMVISYLGNEEENRMKVTYEKKNAMTFIGYHTEIRPEEGYQKCPEFWDKEYAAKYARLWQTMKPENEVEKAILENQIGMYAICADSQCGFTYWIAGLYQGGEVPAGLELYSFPEGNWAMFTAKGPMPGSLQTLNTAVRQE